MHSRRKFDEAFNGSKKGQTLAEQGLKFYQRLYELEDELRELAPEERKERRLKKAVPIWGEFEKWLFTHKDKVPPKAKIGTAF